jgi:phage host-nuclease inhibitor protein Gam
VSDVLDRLEASLRPDDAPDQPTEGWSITGLEAAAWASRKAAEARRKQAEVKAWAEGEKARIDAIVAAEVMRYDREADFFEQHLVVYLRSEIEAGRKTKSLELPGGTIKLTARQPKLDVDADAFLAWAVTSRPEFVRVKQEVDKTALKRAAVLAEDGVVVVDGEIVPGATWEAQSDNATFSVTEEAGGGVAS